MGMRLLNPSQGKSRRDIEITTQERRIIELDSLIEQKRLELQNIDRQFVKTLTEKGAEHYEEEGKWRDKIQSFTEEVEQLEARKRRALVPLEEKETMLQDMASALFKREEQAKIKESDLIRTKELLENKLDEISEREQEATDYSLVLANRERNIQFQEVQIQERMKALTIILQESYDEIQDSQQEVATRKAIIKGRDITLDERERRVKEQEDSFANRERAIADKYKTLMRAITETNLKNNVSTQNPTRDSG